MKMLCILSHTISYALLIAGLCIVGFNFSKFKVLDPLKMVMLVLFFSVTFAVNGLLHHGHHRMKWAEKYSNLTGKDSLSEDDNGAFIDDAAKTSPYL